MSEKRYYKNQVLPDIFRKEATVFLNEKDLIAKLTKAMNNNETIYAYCSSTDQNTGELELEFLSNCDVIGYVPIEEVTYKLDIHSNDVHKGRSIDNVDKIIGVKILEISHEDDGFVMVKCSRKNAVKEVEKMYNRDIRTGEFTEGMIVKGIVSGMDYNKVYVEIGGDVTAILGVADISRVFVRDPADIINIGDELELAVKKLYPEDDTRPIKVSLSRAMMLSGWDTIDRRFKKGKIVPGIVKNPIPSGVFIELSESFEGLAEVLPDGKKYNYGDRVLVCILNIDKKREKIKLKVIENR